jgi:large subunit ribosomal protein L44
MAPHVRRALPNVHRALSGLAVSAAHIRRFPPRDALFEHKDTPAPPFSPEAWAAIQPPPPAALSAFANRLGLPDSPSVPRACTHPSFLALFRQLRPAEPLPATNAHLAALGNSLMGLFATEHLHAAYPHLPTRVLKAAVTAYVGPLPCATVAQEIGAAPLLRWHRTVRPLFFLLFPFSNYLFHCSLPRQRVQPCSTQTPSLPFPVPSLP